MNLYEKLVEAKNRLLAMNIKKSGKNSFSNYDYYELSDFLPAIVKMEKELKFCCTISFGIEKAELLIVDMEDINGKTLVTSPMSTAELKGMHAIQNLGAVQTYLRRYLYMSAFEIVEHDAIDGADTSKKADAKPATAAPKPASKQEAPTDDISKMFLPNVQYRVKKSKSGTYEGKNFNKITIEESGQYLDVYDYECHQVNEGDFIIIKQMRPIKPREYQGKTYYSTSGTIDLANSLSKESFVDDNTALPFEV